MVFVILANAGIHKKAFTTTLDFHLRGNDTVFVILANAGIHDEGIHQGAIR
jgi:hypothetical protein